MAIDCNDLSQFTVFFVNYSKGFTHHDVGIRWHSDYNHLAYRPASTVPMDHQKLFHQLACKDIDGPKLRCQIPETMKIEQPSPILSALDRLKNYDKNDVTLTQFDGMFVSTTTSPLSQKLEEEEEEEERNMFDDMAEHLNNLPPKGNAEAFFSSSLDDADLPSGASISTHEALKHTYYECCEIADNTGMTVALHNKLNEFIKESREEQKRKRSSVECVEEKPSKKTRYVAMTNVHHTGPGRVFNTKKMPPK